VDLGRRQVCSGQFGKLIALENTAVTTDVRLREPARLAEGPHLCPSALPFAGAP
jgi:hypothetical protein